MRTQILLVVFTAQVFYSIAVFGQSDSIPQQRELGFRPNAEFTHFRVAYKKQFRKNSFHRWSGEYVSGAVSWQQTSTTTTSVMVSHRFSVLFGRENRKKLDEKLWFYTGWEGMVSPFFRLSRSSKIATAVSIQMGLGAIFGLYFDINRQWALALETVPGVVVTQNFSGEANKGDWTMEFYGRGSSGLTIVRKL